jgi:hypothetical protein
MEIVKQKEFETLLEDRQRPSVSIFMPTYQKGREVQQNPIRLKNLLKQAEERLGHLGLGSTQSRDLLAPAGDMLDDAEFWKYQKEGLALFLSEDLFRYCRAPFSLEELVVVNSNRFHIKPVLPLLTEDSSYYVLALSQNRVRLVQCARFDVRELDLENTTIPLSIEEALQYDDPEKQLQFRSSVSGSPSPQGSRWASVFHGHGVVDEVKDDLRRYFLQIDRGILEVIGAGGPPLVLAGVDYLLPIYAEANKYSSLVDQGITGNPDHLEAEELHEKSWPIVEPQFRNDRERAAEVFSERLGTGLASNDIREVVPAAHIGRVDSLFVAVGMQVWGTFDPERDSIIVHDELQPGDEDLLDLAAFLTLNNSGKVFLVAPEDVPDSTSLAAVFRY